MPRPSRRAVVALRGAAFAAFAALGALGSVVACSHAADGEEAAGRENRPGAGPASASSAEGCGRLGAQDCPLQAWMKDNMTPPALAGDAALLRQGFQRVAELAPPGYERWRGLALSGAAVAAAGDIAGAKRVCKECHDAYRPRYRRELRPAMLPGGSPSVSPP